MVILKQFLYFRAEWCEGMLVCFTIDPFSILSYLKGVVRSLKLVRTSNRSSIFQFII